MISVISGRTNSLVTTVAIGGNPQGIAFDPANHDIYAARKDGALSLINDQTNTVVNTIRLGTSLFGLVFDPSDSDIFVTDSTGGKIFVLDSRNISYTIIYWFHPGRIPVLAFWHCLQSG